VVSCVSVVGSREDIRRVAVGEASSARERYGFPKWADSTPPDCVELRRPLAAVAADIVEPQRSATSLAFKRLLDVVVSATALALLAPVLAVIALVVKISSRGPALFAQDRVGKGGRIFRFYKFRSMVVDAEERKAELEHLNEMSGPVFKIARDPRITRVGAFLRKTSLDELPQFWNVLKGDMSLVGPRPPLPAEVERYTKHHAQRLSVTPGITGLWQVSGRSNISDFDTWVEMDLRYVREWSVWLDVQILVKTPAAVVFARGAH